MDIPYREIEQRWQSRWEEQEVYRVKNESDRPKYYVLDMFPYPSGSGLHVGHPLGYIATDIYSRYRRMLGYNVLHPMGFDAFGLPAEQYAIETGVHPAEATEKNIQRFKEQLKNLGTSYDWSREIKTCDPNYYKWTQWIFLQLYEHYYDRDHAQAMPIDSLIKEFEANGNRDVHAANSHSGFFTASEWKNMSSKAQDEVLMDYRLAYRKVSYVNWCEELGTVLANDEVKDGRSERGGYPVIRKPMLQWSLRITAYADRLNEDLDTLDWEDSLKAMQRHWIGRSSGVVIRFPISHHDESLNVYTTRPDTLFGATFMVLAPEHPMVEQITTEDQRDKVESYQEYIKTRSERERMSEHRITGVFTGAYARHPFTDEQLPVWIAEYVLPDYGTGAIMAVPANDERDHKFAEQFGLPIIEIIDRSEYPDAEIEDRTGIMKSSDFLNGLEVEEAIERAIEELERKELGFRQKQYKMRDANFSRQRYWGEPFPILYDDEGISYAMEEDELPLELPELEDFKPGKDGSSPLARKKEWLYTEDGMKRETDTMPGFAGSSWYFLRFMDPRNDKSFASEDAIGYWRDVDLYIGGTEHAVGHLMYARFWHKFLYDKGLVPTEEPFKKLINQGMIQSMIEQIYLKKDSGEGPYHFYSARLVDDDEARNFLTIPVHIDFVKNYGDPSSYLDLNGMSQFIDWRPEYEHSVFHTESGEVTFRRGKVVDGPDEAQCITHSEMGKMSKSKYNVVNPDDVVDEYGIDCFRMYEMFLGPIDQSKPWDTQGIDGISRFLRKFWLLFFDKDNELIVEKSQPGDDELNILHECIDKVREDIERFSFNTCISAMMVCVNDLKKLNCHSYEILEPLTRLLAPFAPHIAEEIWSQLGETGFVVDAAYPVADPTILEQQSIEYPICINGKKRGETHLPAGMDKEDIEAQVPDMDVVQKWTEGQEIKRIIVVPERMINVVV